MKAPAQQDLVVLVADKNMESALRGLLNRPSALGIRTVTSEIFVHPERDPGCYLRAQAFLGCMVNKYRKAMVLFDHDGCGAEARTREALEAEVEGRLAAAGWEGRSRVVVLHPELEIWIWSDSPHVPEVLGWRSRTPPLPDWLRAKGLWPEGEAKPPAPKEAMEEVLRTVRLPRSAALYRRLADLVSLERCTDAAFVKLKKTLQEWFPNP